MKLPEFTVEISRYSNCGLVRWRDNAVQYHFWITPEGELKNTILHRNSIDCGDHRELKSRSKRWAPTIDGIMRKIRDEGLLEAAAQRAAQEKRDAEAEAARLMREHLLSRLFNAVALLPASIQAQIRDLPEETLLAFFRAIIEE